MEVSWSIWWRLVIRLLKDTLLVDEISVFSENSHVIQTHFEITYYTKHNALAADDGGVVSMYHFLLESVLM